MKLRTTIFPIVLATVALGGPARAQSQPAPTPDQTVAEEDHGWIAEEEDNICGIKDLKKVTNPAIVDYDDLLDATPQVKEIKAKDIDPDSVKGKALMKDARTLISKTAELVRSDKGHCSVWKEIANKDERVIADLTEAIIERF